MGRASGAISGAAAGSAFGPIGTAIGGGLGLLFGGGGGGGGDKDERDKTVGDEYLQELAGNAGQLRREGAGLRDLGIDTVSPAVEYLKNLLGNNAGAVMDATRQDRGRVIDQYDTARRAIANFGPRGGGTTSTLAQSRFDQAESLADITSTARRDAFSVAGDLGVRLQSLGLTANQLASQDLSTIINTVLTREGFDVQERGQNMQAATGAGEALGTLIGIILTRNSGGGEAGA